MGFLNKVFGTRNAAKAARPYLDQIPGYGREAYQPDIDQGRRVDPGLEQQYGQMSNDPTGMINAIMEKYKESPFYQKKRDQQLGAARSSAASGGYATTPYAQEQQMELADILASGDMQQWLQNAMGVKTQGDAGLQGISNRGFQASAGLGDYLGSAFGQRGNMEAGGVAGQNAGSQALINALASIAASAAGGSSGGNNNKLGGGGGGSQWNPSQPMGAGGLGGGYMGYSGGGGGAPGSFDWRGRR